MATTPTWWRRLFRQAGTMKRPRRLADLGFSEASSDAVLRDGYRVDHLAAAKGGPDRLESSYSYFRKTLKHSRHLAFDAGDDDLADLIDERCEWLAGQIVNVVSELEGEMRARGYDREL